MGALQDLRFAFWTLRKAPLLNCGGGGVAGAGNRGGLAEYVLPLQPERESQLYRLRTLTEQLDKSLLSERLLASLSGVFGGLATVLVAIRLYGVMAYMVVRRTHGIGIRMALGAASVK